MKTLIVHPADPTTNFLSRIYDHLKEKTVVNGGVSKSEVRELLASHERVILLGHGAPYGLMNTRQFHEAGIFVVDGSMVSSLKNKPSNIYIWCHADQFVNSYGLSGLCSGMFVSEMGEAYMYGFDNINQGVIDQSNETFSTILSKCINEPVNTIYRSLLNEYEVLARVNPVARFNFKRLQLIFER